MKIDPATLVETIAASVPGAIGIFETAGIDYACGGRLSLSEAAQTSGVDCQALVEALAALPAGTSDSQWTERSVTDIAHQIIDGHHAMIREQLPRIALGLAGLRSTTAQTRELLMLRAELASLSGEIIPHLHDEEQNVFQMLESMDTARQRNERPAAIDHDLQMRIAELTVAHGSIAQRLHRIHDLRLHIRNRLDVSPECREVLALLEKFEAHLRQQMFIENCILFPRALALQEQLSATA